MHTVQFLYLEENDKDLIVSFAIDDAVFGVKNLTLLRTLFLEELLDEEERGVKVSFEGDEVEQDHLHVLNHISINGDEVEITSAFRKYELDLSRIDESEKKEMVKLLHKQNHDNRFTIQIA
jgi:hypothetical protein